MCRGAGLSTAAGVPGWGWGEKGTVWFACPGAWWRQPKTGENVSQPRIQFGSGMRTVTWDSATSIPGVGIRVGQQRCANDWVWEQCRSDLSEEVGRCRAGLEDSVDATV